MQQIYNVKNSYHVCVHQPPCAPDLTAECHMYVTNIADVINYSLTILKLYIPVVFSYNWLINRAVKRLYFGTYYCSNMFRP
jgi:hypothetical protein